MDSDGFWWNSGIPVNSCGLCRNSRIPAESVGIPGFRRNLWRNKKYWAIGIGVWVSFVIGYNH